MSEAAMSRERRQYVRFAFYKVSPDWRRLAAPEREAMKREFADLVEGWEQRMLIRTYSTVGTRADCDFMIWQVSEELDNFAELAADLNAPELGAYLDPPYGYLSMTKHSMYVDEHVHADQEGRRLTIAP